MLVRESLSRFDLLNEEFLAENVLNEKIDINLIANRAKKIGVLSAMFLKFLLISGTGEIREPENLPSKQEIAENPVILKLANEDYLSKDEIFKGFEDILAKIKSKKEEPKRIFSAGDPGFVEAVNKIKPGRLDSTKIEHYDQYDKDILAAVDKLREKGEDADPNLIKAMMIIETGMNPRKNNLGFEGFPQTKEHILNGWTSDSTGIYYPGINQKYGTNFTIKDMYNPEKAAEFMYYYLKTVSKSKYVDDLKDLIIAYNWGLGNLKKYKEGEKALPQESIDYAAMVDTMSDFFPSTS
jgi:hypothetical protein